MNLRFIVTPSCKAESPVVVPEGHTEIAQRFSVGIPAQKSCVPKGRPLCNADFSRPFWDLRRRPEQPNAEALGYCQMSLPGQAERGTVAITRVGAQITLMK